MEPHLARQCVSSQLLTLSAERLILLMLHVCSVLCHVTVAYGPQSNQVFHDGSSRTVSGSVATVSQQIHGGEALLLLLSCR